ncbi:hypothetical protein GC194_04550 [bacterium]|nr:hypothetical protein [bacterium]
MIFIAQEKWPPFKHFIITRFNIIFGKNDKKGRSVDQHGDWLLHRCALFERFCLPSVLQQTDKNFEWLLFFDSETKAEVWKKYDALPQVRVCLIDNEHYYDDRGMVQEVLGEIVKNESYKYLITTRLDNDDALHPDFVAGINAQVNKMAWLKHRIVQYSDGFELSLPQKKVWQIHSPHYSHSFLSFIEKYQSGKEPLTCFNYRHVEMKKHYRLKNLKKPIGWLRLIHERNLYNDLQSSKGRRESDLNELGAMGFDLAAKACEID